MASPPRTHWRALAITAAAPSLGAAAAFFIAPGPLGNALFALAKTVLYATPLIWLWRIERAPLSLSPTRKGGLALGLASGLLIGGSIAAAYWLFARAHIDTGAIRAIAREVGFHTESGYLVASVWLIGVNALLEEYAFRWFVYARCRSVMSSSLAVVVAALIFAAHHVIVLRAFFDWPFVLVGSSGVFLGGLLWTWAYRRYASIWPGYLSHALADLGVLAVGWDLLFR